MLAKISISSEFICWLLPRTPQNFRPVSVTPIEHPSTPFLTLIFSDTHTRIGLMQFSTKPRIEIQMQSFSSHETFKYEIDRAKLNLKNQGFNAYAGLKEGFEMMRYQNNRSSKV